MLDDQGGSDNATSLAAGMARHGWIPLSRGRCLLLHSDAEVHTSKGLWTPEPRTQDDTKLGCSFPLEGSFQGDRLWLPDPWPHSPTVRQPWPGRHGLLLQMESPSLPLRVAAQYIQQRPDYMMVDQGGEEGPKPHETAGVTTLAESTRAQGVTTHRDRPSALERPDPPLQCWLGDVAQLCHTQQAILLRNALNQRRRAGRHLLPDAHSLVLW